MTQLTDDQKSSSINSDTPELQPQRNNSSVSNQLSLETRTLESNKNYWQGWNLSFDATSIIPNHQTASEQNRTFQIRRVTEDNRIGEHLHSFVVNRTGKHVLETSSIQGNVVLLYQSEVVYVTNGNGFLSSPPDNTPVSTETSRWSIEVQTAQIRWVDRQVYPGQLTHLSVESNRESFTLGVSANNVSFTELENIFPEEQYATNHDRFRDEGILLLSGHSQFRTLINTTNTTPRIYQFDLYALDTTLKEETNLTVRQPSQNSQFVSVDRTQVAGDYLTATIHCSQCYLLIGSPQSNVIELLELTDTTGDDQITLRINSRFAGMYPDYPGMPENVSAYDAGPDAVSRIDSTVQLASERTLAQVRSRFDLRPNGRDAPLRPGLYDLTITQSTHLLRYYTSNQPPPLQERLQVRDTTDVTTIRLVDPSLDSIESYTLPAGSPYPLTLEAIYEGATAREKITLGDRLLFKIDTPGIFGYLQAVHNNRLDGLNNNIQEGLFLTITGEYGTPPLNKIDLSASRANLLADPVNNSLFVTFDTSHLRPAHLMRPQRLIATLQYRGVHRNRPRYSVARPTENARGYPYLPPGDQRTVQTTVTFRDYEDSAVVHEVENELLRPPNDFSVPISGTATVAPGSQIRIVAVSHDPHEWISTTQTTVQSNGDWHATLDFNQAKAGQRFQLSVTQGNRTLTAHEGIVSKSQTPPTTTVQDPRITDTTQPGTPISSNQSPSTPSPQSTPSQSTQPSSPSQPTGFVATGWNAIGQLLPNPPALSGVIGLITLLLTALGLLGVLGSTALAILRR